MSNYTKTTDFEAKDSLPTGDSGKIIRGAEFETEFDAISTAIATKADTAGPTFTGTLTFETISDGTIGVTAFVDEDDMSSNSATLVPTQQSVKAYVDSQVTAQDLDFQADTGGALSIDLDSETLTFTGGTGVDTSGSGNAVTFAIDSTVATLTGSQTLTNKTLTSPVLNTGVSGTAVLDEDDMSSNSATQLATQQSIKAYVDSQVGANNELSEILANGNTTGGTNIVFGDSASVSDDRLVFGAGSDLQIYHSGVHSYIDDAGTGNLTLRGNASVRVEKYEGEILADFAADGAVSLYHDNSVKIATTSTGVNVTGNVAVSGTVDGRDVATDGTKLDGIEAGATADQTAAEIRTLVEAATDSNVFTDADHTKLDGIEAGATGDQTNAEIRAAVEAATDSNVFTDADHSKLDGIEAGADVTDTANVTAAGALMDSELTSEASVKALNQGVATTDSPTFVAVETDEIKSTDGINITIDSDDNSSANSFTVRSGSSGSYETLISAGEDGAARLWYDNNFKLTTQSTGVEVTGVLTSDGIKTDIGVNGIIEANSTSDAIADGASLLKMRAVIGSAQNEVGNIFIKHVGTSENTGEIVFSTMNSGTLAERLSIDSTGIDVTGTVTADDAVYIEGSSPRVQLQDTDGTTQLSFFQQTGEDLVLRLRNNTADGGFTVAGYGGASTTNRFYVQPNGDISFYEDTGTTAKFFWDASAESLGIGTSSPASLLQILGSPVATSGALATFRNSDATSSNTSFGGILFNSSPGTDYSIGKSNVNATTTLSFRNGNTGVSYMDIDSSGQVGIGTSSPSSKVDIVGGDITGGLKISADKTTSAFFAFGADANETRITSTSYGGYKPLTIYTGGTERMRIDASGNVGIGNTSPSAKFTNYKNTSISGSAGATLSLEDDSQPRMMMVADSSTSYISSFDSNPITFSVTAGNFSSSTGTERMRIDASGNLIMTAGGTIRAGGVNDLILDAGESGTPDIYLQSGGSTKVKIEGSNGNVGIGTSNPDTSLHVTTPSGTKTELNLAQTAVTNYRLSIPASTDALTFVYGASTERMRIDASGNVTIGSSTLSADAALKFQADTGTFTLNHDRGTHALVLSDSDGTGEILRVDTSGNLLVGTTTGNGTNADGFNLYEGSGGSRLYIGHANGTANGTQYVVFNYNSGQIGSISQSGTTAVLYNTTSDQRLKDNIVDAPSASDDIDAIQVRSFDWKADGSHQKYGMVAQELQSVAPEAVSGDADSEDMMGVDYSKLVPMLVKEIQSLRARVAQLEGEN